MEKMQEVFILPTVFSSFPWAMCPMGQPPGRARNVTQWLVTTGARPQEWQATQTWWLVLAHGPLPAWKSCLCALPSRPETPEPPAAWKCQQAGHHLPGQCHHKPREGGKRMDTQLEAFYWGHQTLSSRTRHFQGWVGIKSSRGALRQHSPERRRLS